MEDHDYLSFDEDGNIEEIVRTLDISDYEVEDYQIFTQKILATNENPQMSFASNNKTKK